MQGIRLGFDASPIQGNKTGVEYYALRIYEALKKKLGTESVIPFSNLPIPEIPETVVIASRDSLPLWRQIELPKALKAHHITSLHSPVTAVPYMTSCPTVATVHDLSYRIAFENISRISRYTQILNCSLAMRCCRKVVAVSNATGTLLKKYYPSQAFKIKMILSGALANPPAEEAASAPRLSIRKPYLMQLGRLDSRKQPLNTLEAFAVSEVHPDCTLVFVGSPGNASGAVSDWLKQHPEIAANVIMTGYLPDSTVHSLLKNAEALIYPSTDEGFGHPPFEALNAGVVPIVSDIPVTRELLQTAALFAPVGDAEAFAANFRTIRNDHSLKDRILSDGKKRLDALSWDVTAEAIAELHFQLAEERRKGR